MAPAKQHDHDHGHGHGHDHGHGDSSDWEALADSLELDAAIMMPIVDQLLGSTLVSGALHVLDVGCGPGVITVRIAQDGPRRSVTAIDSSEPLLDRVRRRAADAGVADRVVMLVGDLDHALPSTESADLAWASMVLHHVRDPSAALERLRCRLAPGGVLVMVEFGNAPTILGPEDQLARDGTWARFQAATADSLTERLGFDPVSIDWPAALSAAGFTDITDEGLQAVHPAPLSATARAWLMNYLRRGIEMAADRLDARDLAALSSLVDDALRRDDLAVVAERRVLTARRPHTNAGPPWSVRYEGGQPTIHAAG
jgi:ubiquinone/menaquinone biosynthesis C-methylase UbiE